MHTELSPLNLPQFPFKITQKDEKIYIFDEIRKKHLVLTPEEWVRQHFIQYLIKNKGFSSALIQIEGGLKVNSLAKRSDIVAFDRQGNKCLLVECKAPEVTISQATFDQAARYNLVHRCPWIAVTNGIQHYYAKIDHQQKSFVFVEELPAYDVITASN
jgi:hypothetical protein